jgi:uroporphyrinogen decarboxylase
MTPKERLTSVFNGQTPDRPPIFERIVNDEIIEHFAGCRAEPGHPEVVYKAYAAGGIDGTRPYIPVPCQEGEEILSDGRRHTIHRWTSWADPVNLSLDEIITRLREKLDKAPEDDATVAAAAGKWEAEYEELASKMSPCSLVGNYSRKIGLMAFYVHYGWESFAYLQADEPELIDAVLENTTTQSVRAIEALNPPEDMPAMITCMDIAAKNGPMFSPKYLRQSFFPRLERIVDAYHRKGIPFIFHSDGNLMPILDDLVACGIDGLNPIEIAAGMDVVQIRRRHPELVLVGGVDTTHLLPNAEPPQVRKAVRELIELAGPRLLIGSSTEVGDDVPLDNFLAMIDEVQSYSY